MYLVLGINVQENDNWDDQPKLAIVQLSLVERVLAALSRKAELCELLGLSCIEKYDSSDQVRFLTYEALGPLGIDDDSELQEYADIILDVPKGVDLLKYSPKYDEVTTLSIRAECGLNPNLFWSGCLEHSGLLVTTAPITIGWIEKRLQELEKSGN